MTGHAPLAPSGASKWLRCHMAPIAERGLPRTSSYFADEGTAMHEIRARCLSERREPEEFIGEVIDAGRGRLFTATPERIRPLRSGLDRIRDLVGEFEDWDRFREGEFIVEGRLKFPDPRLKDVYGTLDLGILDLEYREIIISDLKFGKGIVVEAEDNEQQLIYALLFWDNLSKKDQKKIDNIRIIIDQPRINFWGGNEWVITPEYLEEWRNEVLLPAVESIAGNQYAFNPGAKQCFWCGFKKLCPAYNHMVGSLAEEIVALNKIGRTPALERRSFFITNAQMIHGWLKQQHDYAMADAKAGDPVPGMKMIHSKAKARQWREDEIEHATAYLTAQFGADAFRPRELITPTQAIEQLPRSEEKIIDLLSRRDPPELKLVPNKHKSPAVSPTLNFIDETGE